MIVYDKQNDRLIVYEHKASRPEFWEELWKTRDLKSDVLRGASNYWLYKITRNFLKKGSKILEGGCGRGQNVYGLQKWGYDAYGVDFAFETILRTQSIFPDLKIFSDDVRKMHFSDNFFDGYWSLGVIERFWEGYEDIIREAHRVIKPGGYFFVTFPWISPMRRNNIKRGKYPMCDPQCVYNDEFYQFIMTDEAVRQKVESYGFSFVSRESYDALKGIKYEKTKFTPILQFVYDRKNIVVRGIRYVTSLVLKERAGHMCLCVFKKLSA